MNYLLCHHQFIHVTKFCNAIVLLHSYLSKTKYIFPFLCHDFDWKLRVSSFPLDPLYNSKSYVLINSAVVCTDRYSNFVSALV